MRALASVCAALAVVCASVGSSGAAAVEQWEGSPVFGGVSVSSDDPAEAVVTGSRSDVGVSGGMFVVQVPFPFGDVDESHTHSQHIRALDEMGVLTYCDRVEDGFCPDDPIDRKTMAVWVVRILDGEDPPRPPGGSRFDDVDCCVPVFYSGFIERLAELGVTRGCGDGSGFCPPRSVTRAEMAAFLSRAFDLPDGPDPGFSDVPGDAWYAADVARLAASGITLGCGDGTRFCPDGVTTRAEMAAFLNRAISHDQPEEELIEEEDADSTDPGSSVEVHVLRVYYCGPEGVYDQQHLNEEVQRFNTVIGPFYRQQSLGAVDVRFEAAGIVSPDVDWSDEEAHNIGSWSTPRNRAGPCNSMIPNMPPLVPSFDPNEELDLIVVLAHIPPGPPGDPIYGYARPLLGPAVVPTAEKVEEIGRYSSTEHLGIVAHEIGHVLWDFKHPDEEGRTSSHDSGSLMSHETVLDLSEAYIACYQRQQEGWVGSGSGGCGPASDAGDDPGEPEVILTIGDSARGDGVCSSVHCRWMHVEIRNFGAGPHTLACAHNGIQQTGEARGVWRSATIEDSDWPATRSCFFGYPGTEVFVVVGAEHEDGYWRGGVYSNILRWPDCNGEPHRCS